MRATGCPQGPEGPEGPAGVRTPKVLRSQKWKEPEGEYSNFFVGNTGTGTADAMLTTTNASTAVYTSAASILNK